MIGKKIVELASIDSSNAFANKLLSEHNAADGDVVWAHEQFAGRGQHDHTWESESGRNLTFTVILRPAFLPPDRQFLLTEAVSLALVDFVRDALRSYETLCPPVLVKWPNDIYVGNHKIGGILIEHKIMGSTIDSSIVGIGLNINQGNFHPGLPNPISLIHILERETDLKDALILICRLLDNRYTALRESGAAGIDREFSQNLLGFNQWRDFTRDGAKFEGKIEGVGGLGNLVIETRSGEVVSFNHGEVEFLF
ncbi:MAG: biotin--[acetyl-CoA-carboxylase] ligase [Bacteroidota bacterium]